MNDHVFIGFGFGPIQAGLFAKEAFESGNFRRIVVAEIDQRLGDAVWANRGTYYVNVARKDRVETEGRRLRMAGPRSDLVRPKADRRMAFDESGRRMGRPYE